MTQKLRDFKAEKSRGWNFVSVKIYIARRGDDEQHFIIQFLQAPPFHGKICRHRLRRNDVVEDEENFPARRIWKCLADISRSPSLIPASFHQAFNFHTRRLASTESRCGDVTFNSNAHIKVALLKASSLYCFRIFIYFHFWVCVAVESWK